MNRTKAEGRPRIRLIWDELLSHAVPRALRELGFNTTHVGNDLDGTPPRGSVDGTVIEFALRTNQVVVTSNHDMIILCNERGQQFVWLDPRGRQLDREEQVLLVFRQIRDWEQILEAGLCVHALRTKAKEIPSEDAARLVSRRYRELTRRKRATKRRTPLPEGQSSIEDSVG